MSERCDLKIGLGNLDDSTPTLTFVPFYESHLIYRWEYMAYSG